MRISHDTLHLFPAEVAEWSRARKKAAPLAGLQFWTKTNQPRNRVLASRHWPHLLVWSWAIWGGPWRHKMKFGFYRTPGTFLFVGLGPIKFIWSRHNSGGSCEVAVWPIHVQRFWQDETGMIARASKDDAVTYVACRVRQGQGGAS